MPRLIFLFLALGLLALNSAGLPHPGSSSSNPDSGWEVDPDG